MFRGGSEGSPEGIVDGDGGVGPSPMQTLLLSLAGCTGADVVDTLRKMRVQFAGLQVRIEGERVADPPRRYTRLRLIYEAHGIATGGEAKVRRAIALSQEKYCSVMHTLRPDIEVTTEVVVR